jgi:hypothetical protein
MPVGRGMIRGDVSDAAVVECAMDGVAGCFISRPSPRSNAATRTGSARIGSTSVA